VYNVKIYVSQNTKAIPLQALCAYPRLPF